MSGVLEKYIRAGQDMNEGSGKVVKCAVGVTECFRVEAGLHQGSALDLFLFRMVMDRLTDEIKQDSSAARGHNRWRKT